MASAPTPGVGDRKEVAAQAKMILTITVRGESHTLALNNVPLKERLLVRKETGFPLETFIGGVEADSDKVGLDTFQILWWLARRASGEWQLTLTKVSDTWPDDIQPDDLELKVDDLDPEADDPEA